MTIENGTIGTSSDADYFPGQVYGGYVTQGSGNDVTVRGGTVYDAVGGGFIQGPVGSAWNPLWTTAGSRHAVSNDVRITGGNLYHYILGGTANTGDAVANRIEITGGTITGDKNLVGGYTVEGNANDNHVVIETPITGHTGTIRGGEIGSGDIASPLNLNQNTVKIAKSVETVNISGAYFVYNTSSVTFEAPGTVTVSGGKTFVEFTLSEVLQAGKYDIELRSAEDGNPYFTAPLAAGFSVDTESKGGGGGGDAGVSELGLVFSALACGVWRLGKR